MEERLGDYSYHISGRCGRPEICPLCDALNEDHERQMARLKERIKPMAIRAKMTLQGVFKNQWGGMKAIFSAVYDPNSEEDRSFQKATPTANAEFAIDNPVVYDQLVIGQSYYFDITKAE